MDTRQSRLCVCYLDIPRDDEVCVLITQGLVQNSIILNVCAPDNGAPQCTVQNLRGER